MRTATRTRFGLIFLLAPLCLTSICFAATNQDNHGAFTRTVENAIEWSQHVKTEVSKCREMDTSHAKQEMSSLRGALEEMTKVYVEVSKQPAPEIAEGHFVAVKLHQNRAEAAIKILDTEFAKSNLDYGYMKKTAKALVAELEAAAREHKAERNELDVK